MRTLINALKLESLILFVVILIFNSVYLFSAIRENQIFDYGVPSTSFLPLVLSIAMFIALFVIGLQEFRALRAEIENSPEINLRTSFTSRVALAFYATLAYAGLFGWLGYVLSTFIFAYALLAIFQFRNLRSIAGQSTTLAVAATMVAATYLFFVAGFGIRLPGMGF